MTDRWKKRLIKGTAALALATALSAPLGELDFISTTETVQAQGMGELYDYATGSVSVAEVNIKKHQGIANAYRFPFNKSDAVALVYFESMSPVPSIVVDTGLYTFPAIKGQEGLFNAYFNDYIPAIDGLGHYRVTLSIVDDSYLYEEPEVKPEPEPEPTPEVKPEPKPEPKPEVKPEPKPELTEKPKAPVEASKPKAPAPATKPVTEKAPGATDTSTSKNESSKPSTKESVVSKNDLDSKHEETASDTQDETPELEESKAEETETDEELTDDKTTGDTEEEKTETDEETNEEETDGDADDPSEEDTDTDSDNVVVITSSEDTGESDDDSETLLTSVKPAQEEQADKGVPIWGWVLMLTTLIALSYGFARWNPLHWRILNR